MRTTPGTNAGTCSLTIERDPAGRYVLFNASGGAGQADMTVSGLAARAEIRTPAGLVVAARRGWQAVTAVHQVTGQVMRLDPRVSQLFGDLAAARWSIRRRWRDYEGTLHSGDRTLTLRLAPFTGRHCVIEATGTWTDLAPVALTACYALLVRRKRDQIIMVTAGH